MLQDTQHFYLCGLHPWIFYAREYSSFLFMGSAATNILCYRIIMIFFIGSAAKNLLMMQNTHHFIYEVCSQESSILENTHHFYLWGLQPRIFHAAEYSSFLFIVSSDKNLLCYKILIIFIYGVCRQETSMLQNTHPFLFMGSAGKNLLWCTILIIFLYEG